MLLRLLLVMLLLLIRDGRLLNLESDAKLPARAAWFTQGDIWWRLDLFFDEMKRDGSECRQYHKWYEFFEHQLKKTPLAENNSLGSHVYRPKGRVPNPDAVQEDLASSVALARFMFQASFTTRTDAHREWFKRKLNNAMTRVCEGIGAEPLVTQVDEGRVPWTLHSTGLVSGFAAWMMKGLSGNTSRSLCNLWEDMFKESKLSSSLRDESEGRVPQDWEDVQTNIYDIIAFATMAKHHRAMQSSRSHGLAKTVHEAFMQMHGCLSETLSVGLQFYVIGDYMSQYDAGVAVMMPRKAFLGKRVPLKTIVNIKSIWNLIQGAAKSGTSLRQALILKNQDERSDLHGSSVI